MVAYISQLLLLLRNSPPDWDPEDLQQVIRVGVKVRVGVRAMVRARVGVRVRVRVRVSQLLLLLSNTPPDWDPEDLQQVTLALTLTLTLSMVLTRPLTLTLIFHRLYISNCKAL
jgi:hypothetical protein